MKTKKAAPSPSATGSSLPFWLILAAISLLTWLAYQNCLSHDFTNWDDDKYVYENPILKMEKGAAVREAFAKPYYLLYTPLTLLSYALNWWYQGPEPDAFVLTNILLHILNSLVVVALVRSMTQSIPAAAVAGLAFALHPMHVESVAWISERKDVLYTLFFFAGMLTWTWYQREKNKQFYFLTLLLFLLSCLSKPSAVIFPVILILLDLRRTMMQAPGLSFFDSLNPRKHLDKIPFFLLSLVFGWILLFGVETQGGQTHSEGFTSHTFGSLENVLIAIYSFVWYPLKALFPHPLCAFYAYPLNTEPLPWYIWASPLPLAGFAWLLFRSWQKKQADVFFTLTYFAVAIFLFIKVLTTVGAITYDRYFYVASFSFCLLAGIGFDRLFASGKWRVPALVLAVAISGLWLYKTRSQTEIWKDSYALTGNMLEHYPRHLPFAYNNRGLWLNEKGRIPEAIEQFRNAIRLDPQSPNAWLNAGKSFGELGQPDSAIYYLENCLQRSDGDSKVYNNLGNAYGMLGNFPKALENFQKSLRLDPENANAYYNLGVTYGLTGDTLTADSLLRIAAQKGNEGAYKSLSSRGKL